MSINTTEIQLSFFSPSTPLSAKNIQIEEEAQFILITKKIGGFSQEKLSGIAIEMAKYWLEDFKHQPYLASALKILALPTYAGLLGIGILTSYASINLLYNTNFSSALASNIDERVNFANTITNSGALFACITDFPAITYVLYLFVFKKAHKETLYKILDESYHFCMTQDLSLTSEMHEKLYQQHIAELQALGMDRYYLHPDLLSQTGALHAALAPLLKEIDLEIKEESSLKNLLAPLLRNAIAAFKQDCCLKKSAKIAIGSISLSSWILSSILILESMILLQGTPVGNLFSDDTNDQTNEAFYITQIGCLFSSLTAFGAAAYVFYRLFLQNPLQKTMHEKMSACFDRHQPNNPSTATARAFHRIREVSLK